MPRLLVKNIKTQEETLHNLLQELITLGRAPECDVELPEKSISRKHAEILKQGADYFLIDLKSGNGTYLNGKKIRSLEKNLIRSNDVMKIENFEIRFVLNEDARHKPVEEDTDTDIIEVKMVKKVLGALSKESSPSLEILSGSCEGKKVLFTPDLKELEIGRDSACHLSMEDAVISRFHAKLVRKWGGVVLVDQESRNGTFVNNEKIQEKMLRDGDKIVLGTVKALYRNPQDVNIEALSEEISRKKKEAAFKEMERLEQQRKTQVEEEVKQQAKQAEESEAESPPSNESSAEEKEMGPETFEALGQQETQTPKALKADLPPLPEGANTPPPLPQEVGFSITEKVWIGLGGLVFLIAFLVVVIVLFK